MGNTFVESFNGRLRDERLNVHQLTSMADVQHLIEARRLDYNQRCPHSSLGCLTPNEFVAQRQVEQTTEDVVGSGYGLYRYGATVMCQNVLHLDRLSWGAYADSFLDVESRMKRAAA